MNKDYMNESAFPSTFKSFSPEEGQVHRWGMTLRDYFAAKALPAMLHADEGKWEGNYQTHAERAYKYADAMLEARK